MQVPSFIDEIRDTHCKAKHMFTMITLPVLCSATIIIILAQDGEILTIIFPTDLIDGTFKKF